MRIAGVPSVSVTRDGLPPVEITAPASESLIWNLEP